MDIRNFFNGGSRKRKSPDTTSENVSFVDPTPNKKRRLLKNDEVDSVIVNDNN